MIRAVTGTGNNDCYYADMIRAIIGTSCNDSHYADMIIPSWYRYQKSPLLLCGHDQDSTGTSSNDYHDTDMIKQVQVTVVMTIIILT